MAVDARCVHGVSFSAECDECYARHSGRRPPLTRLEQMELLEWCRVNNASMVRIGDLEVRFAALPQAAPFPPLPVAPPPIIDGADKMTPEELKTATEQAERERLLFRSA